MRIYAYLIASLVATKLALRFFSIEFKTPEQSLMLQWWFLAALSAYGAAGVLLVPRTGFAGMSCNRRGATLALVHGTIIGLSTIATDVIRPVGSIHHPLPEGLLLYWYGAVVSEVWFHLLPVPLLVFLASNVILRGRHQQAMFWTAAVLLSFWEGRRVFTNPDLWITVEVVRAAVTFAANLSEIWLFRRFGFLAAVGQRLASYAWWHILWPLTLAGV